MKKTNLWVLALPLLAACDDKTPAKPDPSAQRSEIVKATGTTTGAPTVGASHAPTAPAAPRKLCAEQPAAIGKSMPSSKVDHLEAAGAPSLGEKVTAAPGKWTWVNFWAAWCGPCKEEIPRLRAFESKLAQQGAPVSLVFVSMDDDERQARQFLDSQPASGGLRSSFWLPDGKIRSSFLEALKLKETAQLPIQLFFDPTGALRCLVDGAVDDGDYPQLQAIFSHK